MIDIESLRTYCLSMPGATECVQWGNDLLFKVGEKMFAATGFSADPGISFKCDDPDFERLTAIDGIIPAPYLARHKWIRLESLQVLPERELFKLITKSYDLVVAKLPKKVRIALEA